MSKLWYLVHKDLLAEWRSRQVWPRMLAVGLTVAYLLSYQLNEAQAGWRMIAGSLCWLTVCSASLLTFGQGMAAEHEDGCWEGLRHYPIAASTVYLARFIVNVVGLAGLQGVVIPFFLLTSGAPFSQPGRHLLVALLGNLAISAIGTLVGAVSVGIRRGQGLLAVLLLPLLVPVILAASKATSLVFVEQVGAEWWRWVQLLGAFTVIYFTAGLVLFEFVVEE